MFFHLKLKKDNLICLWKEAGLRAKVLNIKWSTCIVNELYTKGQEICDRDVDRNFRKDSHELSVLVTISNFKCRFSSDALL